jgi:uncharacterized membrane protein YtjA (UPF0391 family)
MIHWTVTFFIGALVAAFFQFGTMAEGPASIAKVFYFIFMALCVLSVIFEKETPKHTFITTNNSKQF